MRRLIVIESRQDIKALGALEAAIGQEDVLLALYDELRDGLSGEFSGITVLSPEDLLDKSDPAVAGIDEYAIGAADEWFRAERVRASQQSGGVDLGGLLYRDVMYYLIWVLKNKAVIDNALRRTDPEQVVVFRWDEEEQSGITAGPNERIARKIISAGRADGSYEISCYSEGQAPSSSGKKKGLKGFIRDKAKGLADLAICLLFGPRGRQGEGILFSSDLKHVLPVITELRKKGYRGDVFYMRPRIGIRPFLRLKELRCSFVSLGGPRGSWRKIPSPGKNEFAGVFTYNGTDLFPLLEEKFQYIFSVVMPELASMVGNMKRMLGSIRPRSVVVDEDVCPFNKALVQVSAGLGISSAVVQHGMMGIRTGFTPLSSDHFLCWGELDRLRMEKWGVAPAQLHVVGVPRYDDMFRTYSGKPGKTSHPYSAGEKLKVLYINSPYHEHYRPDFIKSHISRSSHLRAMRALCRLKEEYPSMALSFKFHPRDKNKQETVSLLSGVFGKDVVFYEDGEMSSLLADNDIVIAAWSTSCLEALAMKKRLIVINFESDFEMYPIGSEGPALLAFDEEQLKECFVRAVRMSEEDITGYSRKADDFIRGIFPPWNDAASRVAEFVTEKL